MTVMLAALLCCLPARAGDVCPAGERLARAHSWAYWLQAPRLDQLAASGADIVVMDYSPTGTDEDRFTAPEIQVLKDEGKVILAYLSIGEAEDYRFYWEPDWKDRPPSFLGPENEEWGGNYKVKYWTRSWWRAALHPYLERILEAGFDGVYLDIIDAYWYWGEAQDKVAERGADMIRLVAKIARFTAKRTDDNFLVFVQNGLGLIQDAPEEDVPALFRAIDGAGVESVFFNTTPEMTKYRLGLLAELAARGKTLLSVEYIPPDNYAEYMEKVRESGLPLLPYRAEEDRALNSLATQD